MFTRNIYLSKKEVRIIRDRLQSFRRRNEAVTVLMLSRIVRLKVMVRNLGLHHATRLHEAEFTGQFRALKVLLFRCSPYSLRNQWHHSDRPFLTDWANWEDRCRCPAARPLPLRCRLHVRLQYPRCRCISVDLEQQSSESIPSVSESHAV